MEVHDPTNTQVTSSPRVIQILFNKQFCQLELSIKNLLENIQVQITMNTNLSCKLSEEVAQLKNRVEGNMNNEDVTGDLTESSQSKHYSKTKLHPDDKNQVCMNNLLCPKLTEELTFTNHDVNDPETKHVNSDGQSSETPQKQNPYINKLFSSVRLPDVGGSDPMMHKVFWIFIHITAFLISIEYILDAYYNWQNSLIVQGLTYSNVKDIPFPAITICEPLQLREEYNRFKILKRCISVDNKISWLCSDEELKMLRISMDIYPAKFDLLLLNQLDRKTMKKLLNFSSDFLTAVENFTISGLEYLNYIHKLSHGGVSEIEINSTDIPDGQSIEVIRNSVLFTLSVRNISSMYRCQTLNGLGHVPCERGGTVDKNIFNFEIKKPISCRPENIIRHRQRCETNLLYTDKVVDVRIGGTHNATAIKYENDDDSNEIQSIHLVRNGLLKIFLVFFHNTLDYPSVTTMTHVRLTKYSASYKFFYPKLIDAREDLILIDLSKRNCTFSFEKKLSLFDFYTYNNCILECRINCSLTICGCIPHKIAILNSSLNICLGGKSKDCMYEDLFLSWHGKNTNKRCQCDCPLDCVSLTYDVDGDFSHQDVNSDNNTTFQVYPEDGVFFSSIIYSLTSPTEFAAYSLGILGVFNGFSMMIVWDILYWMALYLWSTVNRSLYFNS